MINLRSWPVMLLAIFPLFGCEPASDVEFFPADASQTASPSTASTNAPDDVTTTPFSPDGFDWAAAQGGGDVYPSATSVDLTLSSASVGDGKINFTYTMNDSWPIENGMQGIACAFMQQTDGSWYGGKFDWLHSGGQSLKETTNIIDGYGAFSGHQPYVGQNMAFVWVSVDGKHRSNAAYTTWQ